MNYKKMITKNLDLLRKWKKDSFQNSIDRSILFENGDLIPSS